MKIAGKILLVFVLVTGVLSVFAYHNWYDTKFSPVIPEDYYNTANHIPEEHIALKEKAGIIKQFARLHRYNSEICFLIDMNIFSGKDRFFVYDLKKDSVVLKGLVAHGSCDNGFRETPSFSNIINSGCSSLGKYKIGDSYKGTFGLAYKLSGLDSSNSNAWQRNIVLHSYDCIPEKETDLSSVCNSRGCPMIAPGFLNKLKPIIDKTKKPILLWIFDQ